MLIKKAVGMMNSEDDMPVELLAEINPRPVSMSVHHKKVKKNILAQDEG